MTGKKILGHQAALSALLPSGQIICCTMRRMAGLVKLQPRIWPVAHRPLLLVAPALQAFLGSFTEFFVSTVVCPACLCGGDPLALMNSASEVPIGLSAFAEGRCRCRSVLALG